MRMDPQERPGFSPSSRAIRRTVKRRVGYAVAVTINVILLMWVNVAPGWRAVPFLTPDADEVMLFVNLSLVIGIVVSSVNAVFDGRAVRATGELVSSGAALVMLSQLWSAFPFAFSDPSVDWALIVRVVIGFAIAACLMSMIVQVAVLIRLAVREDVSRLA